MEEYGLDGLVASAEAVLPGLGPLVAGLAGLAVDAGEAVTLDAMELLAAGPRGRALLCGVVQLALDRQAAAEVRVPAVTGADEVARTRAERGHARTVVTTLGEVVVRRIAYRSGVKGAGSLFVRDAALNLPPLGYSWPLQQLVVMFARDGAYELAQELLLAATGVRIGKRQLEQIVAAAAADVPGFYAGCGPGPGRPAEPGQDAAGPLALSADGKGVAMLPGSRRKGTRAPGQRVRNFATRPGIGEKGCKRIAEVACVFDVIPQPRTPQEVMAGRHGGQDEGKAGSKPAPRAVSRRYRVDIADDRSAAVGWLFDEAIRRDPGQARDWIALVDGDNHQIRLIEAEAAARGITCPVILIDLIHVLEYLWKAAWALHAPRDPAIEAWTIAQATDILHGRVAEVTARITQAAGQHPPQGPEHARNITRALAYLQAKQPCLDYPRALAAGWPVATGVIEGACRHLVNDRMGITGARWSTDGAQAILWLRVIHANGDHDAYWHHHIRQEHHRNHLSRYHDGLELAAA
ncbi:MAG TPA: ISKra4 family transposase [Streptosporangiaceae bacterium]|nr:ISKra4 family transposase [Streptosporangiaceae bacterium]